MEKSGTETVITMEWVDGMNLQEYMRNKRKISSAEAAAIMSDLCDALSYLHGCGFIYLDLKPANIMISDSGGIKLVDLDTCISQTLAKDRKTLVGLQGTRGFAAPEQYSGCYPIDTRADIYSLGVTIYVLMTGQDPTRVSDGEFDIKKTRLFADETLCRIVKKCTRVNPDGRYKDVRDLKYELRQIL